MENEVPIAKKIRILRLRKNLTQRQLAKRLMVAHNTVSQYENGTICPSVFTVVQLSRLFNVTTDYLLGVQESEY